MLDLEVIDRPEAASLLCDPIKSRILAELATPRSAAEVAQRVGLTRQKVNYHVNALEAHGLVEPAEQRRWGGITERKMVATAAAYVVSPSAIQGVKVEPAHGGDRLSASYLIALAARVIREVGDLWLRSRETHKRLATLSIDTAVRFATPEDRAAFTRELTEAISGLVARYHDDKAPRGRAHRVLVAAYPAPAGARPET
jgi:DNA-binding transcriptional ArsR family regulator